MGLQGGGGGAEVVVDTGLLWPQSEQDFYLRFFASCLFIVDLLTARVGLFVFVCYFFVIFPLVAGKYWFIYLSLYGSALHEAGVTPCARSLLFSALLFSSLVYSTSSLNRSPSLPHLEGVQEG